MSRKQLFSSSMFESMAVDGDPARVPGKPFLEHLHRVLNVASDTAIDFPATAAAPFAALLRSQGASMRQLLIDQQDAITSQELVINAPCLCYLQKLLHAMLAPTKSEHSGLITQWRLNAAFARQLEENPDSTTNLGAANPERILQLAGRLLEVDALRLERFPSDASLPVPSECDLCVFPKLSRLHLDGIDVDLIHGMVSIASALTELHLSNVTLHSLSSLLAPEVEGLVPSWRNLRTLGIDNVRMAPIEASDVALMPNLETVMFRSAGLHNFATLTRCAWLSVMDLSHNRIDIVDIPTGAFEHLRVLNLSHNHVSLIRSLQGCPKLEVIDLGYNLMLSIDDIQELAGLQQLRSVFLIGNPAAKARTYRHEVRLLLSDEVILDGVPWTDHETASPTTSVRREPVTVNDAKQVSNSKRRQDASHRWNMWSAARGVLRSCVAIAFAQIFVSTVWSREVEVERLTLWIVAATATVSGILVAIALAASWLFEACRRKHSCYGIEEDLALKNLQSQESTIEKFMRGFSANFSLHEIQALEINVDAALDVNVLGDLLQGAVRAGDDLVLHVLDDVCSQLKTMLAYLGGPGGGGIGFAWLRLSRASASINLSASGGLGREELVRDRLSSRLGLALDAAEPTTSFATSLTKALPVIRLCAILLSSITSESDLTQVLRDAYVQVFTSRHQWWRQRSILSALGNARGTDAFLAWLDSAHTHNHHHLIEVLHKCGERLHFLHTSIQELVDEHTHSFGHHFHRNS